MKTTKSKWVFRRDKVPKCPKTGELLEYLNDGIHIALVAGIYYEVTYLKKGIKYLQIGVFG